MRDKLILFGVAVAVMVTVLGVARLCEGDDGPELRDVATAIRTLQPAADLERADELAEVFRDAGRDHRLDPLLLIAVSFRESSLALDVERHERRGLLGEGGLMQTHGAALRYRPTDCPLPLPGARCQVQTGAAWMAQARDHCGGSWWRWVAAYGLGACPSEAAAREHGPVKVARWHYCRIRSDCDQRWPRLARDRL
jgi:hypothetical protein